MKQKKQTLQLLVFLAFTLIFGSCQKQQLESESNEIKTDLNFISRASDGVPFREGANTKLGESKQNPYTVKNMKAAWQELINHGISTNAETSVHTSHYYVKFKPQNSDDYEILHKDTTLAFSDLPIESTVTLNGDYYHDPSLPDSIPTFQYTAVKVGYQFPTGIKYEILDDLYIPEEDEIFNYENGGTEDCFVDKLLNQAYLQTNNNDEIIDLSDCETTTAQRRYTPGGRIRVFDTRLQRYIGMEGVKVQARRWFVVYYGYPNYNGDYRMSHSFKRPCNYSIWFDNPLFAVRHNFFNTTFWINGPHQSGDWNYDLNNSYQRFVGHIFRGAYRYQLKDIGGLKRPWIFFKRQLYMAKDANGSSQGTNWIVLPIIKVWRYNSNGDEYQSDEVFSTTCHETGHTSHVLRMNAPPIQYWQVTGQLQESWAVAIEWYLSHIEYRERGITNYGKEDYSVITGFPNQFAYQYWNNKNFSKKYTSIYIDIVDNYNQLNVIFPGYISQGAVDDQVTGYSLPFIESNLLKHVYGINSLSHELIDNLPSGITEAQVNLLLSHF